MNDDDELLLLPLLILMSHIMTNGPSKKKID